MIIKNNENALRVKCEPVSLQEAEEIIHLLDTELAISLKNACPGIGLAANQIGINKSVAIIRINDKFSVNLVNCEISKKYDEFIFTDEGCLSFPNLKLNTKRYNEICISNNLLYPHAFIATGLFSVAIQHEIDHLNGIVFTDKSINNVIRQAPNEQCLCGSGKKYKKCCKR